MGIAQIFIRKKRQITEQTEPENQRKVVEFDAYIEESHTSALEVSNNPVELGAEITDNAIIVPKEIRLTVAVSDTPMGFEAINAIAGNVQRLFDTRGTRLTRSQQAHRDLILLQESRNLLQVQTGLRLYQNMLITNIGVDQDKDSSNAIEAVIDMQELIIVETEVRAIKKDQLPPGRSRFQAESSTDAGRKIKNKPTTSEEFSLLGFIKGIRKTVLGVIGGAP